jgi:serine/threonine protein kinase
MGIQLGVIPEAAMPASFEESVLGQVLGGRYRLQRVVLRGVFGILFAADEYFGRTFVRPVHVAVSRQVGWTDITAGHYFGDAIRLAQWLASEACTKRQQMPGIIHMDVATAWNHCGFLVTEAALGTPLLHWKPNDNQPALAAQLAIFKDLCKTLAAVHQLGVAHRELRPEAVVIDSAGTVRLLGLGLSMAAEPLALIAESGPELVAHLAPEALQGSTGPAADVYGLGLILYEWLTGGGPHLSAAWTSPALRSLGDVQRLKQNLSFAAPSVLCPEIRKQAGWLDELVLRCLANDPGRRFRDAGQVLEALETCAAGGALPAPSPATIAALPTRLQHNDDAADALIRGARRHLARGEIKEAIDRLDIHRPAEWTVVDRPGTCILRVLGQAYVRLGDWRSGRECLEQLRSLQREQGLLAPPLYAAALTDLLRCYQKLGLSDLADSVRQEARQLLHPR